MNFSSCCHQNLNNQITKIYTGTHQSNDKLVTNIPIQRRESTEEVEEDLDKTELYVLETLNTIHKVLEEGI
jgi:hypothetical protein